MESQLGALSQGDAFVAKQIVAPFCTQAASHLQCIIRPYLFIREVIRLLNDEFLFFLSGRRLSCEVDLKPGQKKEEHEATMSRPTLNVSSTNL